MNFAVGKKISHLSIKKNMFLSTYFSYSLFCFFGVFFAFYATLNLKRNNKHEKNVWKLESNCLKPSFSDYVMCAFIFDRQ